MQSKEKMMKYLVFKGITSYKFQQKTGFSNGVLKSGKDFGTDKLKIIRDNYLDLNMNWLIYDEGEMIKIITNTVAEDEVSYGKSNKEMLFEVLNENRLLNKENKDLRETVEKLKKDNKSNSN